MVSSYSTKVDEVTVANLMDLLSEKCRHSFYQKDQRRLDNIFTDVINYDLLCWCTDAKFD